MLIRSDEALAEAEVHRGQVRGIRQGEEAHPCSDDQPGSLGQGQVLVGILEAAEHHIQALDGVRRWGILVEEVVRHVHQVGTWAYLVGGKELPDRRDLQDRGQALNPTVLAEEVLEPLLGLGHAERQASAHLRASGSQRLLG